MAGAPVGNQNAAKGKKWREAIMRALARKSGSVEQGLDTAADRLVKLMHEGEAQDAKWAIEHAADRIDGKVPQGVIGGDEGEPAIKHQHSGKIELVPLELTGKDPS